jgi:dTDP-4-dehydrorhamnose reductase
MLQLAQRTARFFGLDAALITPTDSASLNQKAKRPPITGFVIDKAKRDLGYAPHSLEEGLAVVQGQL